jgi:hypothetical protein
MIILAAYLLYEPVHQWTDKYDASTARKGQSHFTAGTLAERSCFWRHRRRVPYVFARAKVKL